MDDDIWKRAELQSPCVKLCVMHPEAGLCTGCYRSMDEITDWSRMTAEKRSAILADLASRKPLVVKRRGGRKARLKRL